MNDKLFVCIDKEAGDVPVLIVGRLDEATKTVDILNALQGEKALDLYKKLINKED